MGHSKQTQEDVPNLEGRYVNYFEIGHNAFEFLLDFGQYFCEGPKAIMHTRIVTSPVHAKALVGVLQQAIRQYEERYGQVASEIEAEKTERPRQTPKLKLA